MKKLEDSYLRHLPAIYQEEEFLARFLMIFEDALSPVEHILENIHLYFDPLMAPESFLLWLASWIDLVLDENWSIEKRRQLIKAGAELYRWRGTRRGLKDYLKIYTGVEPEITEHFGVEDKGPHHFEVVVRMLDPKALDERLVRRVINAEKPAHTTYDLTIETID